VRGLLKTPAMLTRTMRGRSERLTDERGVALPLAMIMLVTLTALMVAFSVLANTEPTIANNHQRAAQARALADSGVQRAMWALSNSTHADGIGAMAANTTASAPYDGSSLVSLGTLGGFTVQVTYDPSNLSTERTVTAVGWIPSIDGAHTNPHRKIQVILQMGIVRPLDPPCAICVAGDSQIGGNARVDARNNGCGGANPPTTAVQSSGTTNIAGSGDVYGYGNSTKNEASDYQNGATSSAFKYTTAELAQFKSLAQANGTYYQGAISSIPTSGIVYIDTTTGADYTSSTPDAQAGSLSLASNGTFNGVLIVAGSINIAGTRTFNGLVYSMNDITVTGNTTFNGALVSENRKDTSSTNIDSAATGSVVVNYNCDYVRNGGDDANRQLSTKWMVKSGTYFEAAGY
jgi:Tfp pilus assembly protein PilX